MLGGVREKSACRLEAAQVERARGAQHIDQEKRDHPDRDDTDPQTQVLEVLTYEHVAVQQPCDRIRRDITAMSGITPGRYAQVLGCATSLGRSWGVAALL
jgi:hypothetical protein